MILSHVAADRAHAQRARARRDPEGAARRDARRHRGLDPNVKTPRLLGLHAIYASIVLIYMRSRFIIFFYPRIVMLGFILSSDFII